MYALKIIAVAKIAFTEKLDQNTALSTLFYNLWGCGMQTPADKAAALAIQAGNCGIGHLAWHDG